MIIGIDIDNTISYTTETIMHYAGVFGRQHGLNTLPDLSEYYLEEALGWSSTAVEEFFEVYLEDIYREVQPKEKAGKIIQQLQQEHQILIITSRNRQSPYIEKATREWLQRNEIKYDKLILNATSNMYYFSKLSVCRQHGVEVMIEDHHDLAQELSPFIPVILFDYPYNKHIESENIMRVNNWVEVKKSIDYLAQGCILNKPIA